MGIPSHASQAREMLHGCSDTGRFEAANVGECDVSHPGRIARDSPPADQRVEIEPREFGWRPQIEHRREDAFRFAPAAGANFDWLFCDMVEEPHHVLQHIVEPWLARGWCRRFVVNLKFGRVDPVALLRELRAPESPLVRHATNVRIVHLYHDREEFTVVGDVAMVNR